MPYLINLKKLDEQVQFWNLMRQEYGVEMSYIQRALSDSNIFLKLEDPKREFIRSIAILVANPNNGVVSINLDAKNPIQEGLEYLASSMFRQDLTLVANIEGQGFENCLESKEYYDFPEKIEAKTVSWNVSEKALADSWGNAKFVLKKLTTQENFRFVSPALWTDSNFLNELVKTRPSVFQYIDNKYLELPEVIEVVKTDTKLLNHLWHKFYHDNFNRVGYETMSESIRQTIFTDKSAVLAILSSNQKNHQIFDKLPDNIKYDHEVVKSYCKLRKMEAFMSVSYLNQFPSEFFSDKNNIKSLLLHDPQITIANHPQLTQAWIHNKEDIIEMVKSCRVLAQTYDFLDNKFKEDKDVVCVYLKHDRELFLKLSEPLKQEWDVVYQYLENYGEMKNVNLEMIFNLKNEEAIEYCVKKNNKLLTEDNCPKEWLNNKKFLKHAESLNSLLPRDKLMEIYSDTEFVKSLILKSATKYASLPHKIKLNHEVALFYLTRTLKGSEFHSNHFPGELWQSKEFCLQALKINEKVLSFMPKEFWSDKDIVLVICDLVDNKKVPEAVFKKTAPTEVIHFFESFGVNNSYHSFLNSYLLNQQLEQDLPLQKTVQKKMKI